MQAQTVSLIGLWLAASCLSGWLLPSRVRMPAVAACGAGLLLSLSAISFSFLAVATAVAVMLVQRRAATTLIRFYIGLIIGAYATFLVLVSWQPGPSGDWVVPFGMAYSVLRLIHYVSDADRGRLPAHRWDEAVCYQFFPAVLAVGPINRFDPFLRDMRRRRWDASMASEGMERVLTGALKIVILGNYIVADVLPGMVPGGDADMPVYFATVLFWLSLYIQFSGYTDVAVGVGRVLGFRLPENFNWPIFASSIGEFWRRWHITLADWCRDYVFLPGLARWRSTAAATAASMLTLGLWHEASLHYLLWGLYHSAGLIVWRRVQAITLPRYEAASIAARRAWDFMSWLLTLHFVMFSYPITNMIEKAVLGK